MAIVEELEYIQGLSEEDLRQIVIIPLLKRMGLRGVVEYHGGSSEKGKDIIAYYQGPLGDRHYVAVVAKRGNIHASVSKVGSASEVLFQVEQALNEPYTDIYDLKEVRFDECWIVTSGEIKNTAVESIRGKLVKSNLDKLVRLVDCHRLIELIAVHMPDFWHRDRHILRFVHEIRQPLVAIRARVDTLRRRWETLTTEKRERILEEIETEAGMSLRLVETLAFAQQKDVQPHPERFEIAKMLLSLSTAFPRDHSARVKFRQDSLQNLPMIVGDPVLLKHAIRSVIENALAYSDAEILVEVITDIEGLVITVTDKGIGVPDGSEERIFEFGFRAANAKTVNIHGLGMGLSVARRIFRQHRGEVRLVRPNSPTIFSLSVPR